MNKWAIFVFPKSKRVVQHVVAPVGSYQKTQQILQEKCPELNQIGGKLILLERDRPKTLFSQM